MPILLRLFLVIALLAIGVSFAMYFFTKDRRFLTFAARAFKFSVVFLMVLAGLYVLERLVML